MDRQPNLATYGLIAVALLGILAILFIRLDSQEAPVGLVALTSAAVTALAMASGRRRF